MLVKNVIKIIEKQAPPEFAAAWDKSGIQCFSQREKIEKIAVCLDATPQSVGKAIEWGAQFILSHHPLSLAPGLPSKNDDYYQVLKLLFNADVWLYAAHTSLDANPQGPVEYFGKSLGLARMQVLDPAPRASGEPVHGFGMYGDLTEARPLGELIMRTGEILGLEHLRLCGECREDACVSRIAYCPGSGAECMNRVYENDCDAFITGDIKYHAALEARVPLLDVGHYSFETWMMRRFAQNLKNLMPDTEIRFVPSVDPFRMANIKNMETINE